MKDEKISELYEVYDKDGKFVALFLYKNDALLFRERNGYKTIKTVKRTTWNRDPAL